jgi:hypothetical protein
VVVKYRGTEIIRADVVFSEGKDLIPAAFDIPGDFETRRACNHVSPPVRIKGRSPDYPRRVGQWAFLGRILVQAKIGVDGKVEDAQAVRNPSYAIQPGPPGPLQSDDTRKAFIDVEKAFLDVVEKWTFEPAKCDEAPVVENILIPFETELH